MVLTPERLYGRHRISPGTTGITKEHRLKQSTVVDAPVVNWIRHTVPYPVRDDAIPLVTRVPSHAISKKLMEGPKVRLVQLADAVVADRSCQRQRPRDILWSQHATEGDVRVE